ncbi:hypothetical protein RHMOL_Rhmol04G0218400 [Rhododendron molle]|uniref:Uncharacterized protein n=1 Tax=Rhododendron molle TaxID=49168 RepID=A0ACC0P2V4_RHOML|nr:hypothetical protein RHMOL_Rhmol04G0218400 [Rhododendron molle]
MLAEKSDDLEKVGLKNIITLLRRGIPQNPPLIQAALAFWDPSFNFFRFNCGMMAPTVLDVTQMLGLIPYGSQFDPTKEYTHPEGFTRLTATNGAFSHFYTRERKLTREVSETEFFAYILYTLCKHILCHSGKRVMSEFIPLALALSRGEEFDFASYFLGHVYKVGSDFYQKSLNYSQGGPQWFVQLWLHAYFSELGPFKAPVSPAGTPEVPNVHGDNYIQPVASDTHTLVYYLCFFSGLPSDRELPSPILAPIGPSWAFDILIDKQGKSSRALQAWSNILTCREIFISSSNPSKSMAHVEVYCPAQFARQLGLVQGIPIPYCGSANIFMSERSSISIEHFQTWFTQSRFLEHIEFENSEFGHKNHDDLSLFSSDGGFGVVGGIEDIPEDEVDKQAVPIEASPISMIIPSPPSRRQSSRVPQKKGISFNYLYFCLQETFLMVIKCLKVLLPPPPTTSKRSKTISQSKKIIPTKHYLESSSQPPGLFLLNNCLLSLCLLVSRNHALYLSCFATPKRAKATRQLKLTPFSSDEETETDTGALVSRGKAKETSKALVYERKEKAVRKSKTLDELTFADQLQGSSSNLPIIPHQKASGTMPARETYTHQDSAKMSLDITTLLLSLAESIPPTPFQVRMDFSVLSYITGYIKPNTCIGFPQVFPISVESPVLKSIVDNQLKATKPLGIRRRGPFPYPLQVSEQDSSPRSSTSTLPISLVKSFEKQDSDTPTSSKDQVDNTAIDMEVIPFLELSSLPLPDEPSSPSIDLPIVAFDVSMHYWIEFKDLETQHKSECNDTPSRVYEARLRNIATSALMMPSSWATAPRYRHISPHDVSTSGCDFKDQESNEMVSEYVYLPMEL